MIAADGSCGAFSGTFGPVDRWVAAAAARMETDGQQVDTVAVDDAPCVVALDASGDAGRGAGALFCFTFVWAASAPVHAADIDRANERAFEVVRTMLPGLGLNVMALGRAWVAILPVLAADSVAPDGVAAAQRRHRPAFRGFLWPAAVEVTSGLVATFEGRTRFGGGHADHVRARRAVAVGSTPARSC